MNDERTTEGLTMAHVILAIVLEAQYQQFARLDDGSREDFFQLMQPTWNYRALIARLGL